MHHNLPLRNKLIIMLSVMASLFLVLVIPLGFLWAAIFMGEEITLLKTTGAVLVMIGVVLPHLLQIGIKRYRV